MPFAFSDLLIVGALFTAMLVMQVCGRRLGQRHVRAGLHAPGGHGPVEASIFALLGLFLAFTFSDAGGRFDDRRHLIVEEANAINTAWLRIDLLPSERQAPMRELFRQYLDGRLDAYRDVSDAQAVKTANDRVASLETQIWSAAVAGAEASGRPQTFTVLLSAVNAMFDIGEVRTAATKIHSPPEVYAVIGLLALVGAIFVGYGMASLPKVNWLHAIGFAAVLSLTLYVIIDLEYPRVGLIRVDQMDQVLKDLRASMQ